MKLSLNLTFERKHASNDNNHSSWQGHYQCEINNSNIVGIIGESGSGKSTLLRLIAGLEQPSSDSKLVFNDQVWYSSASKVKKNKLAHHPKINVKPQHRHIAYITQDSMLFPHLTIADNLTLAARRGKLTRFKQNDLICDIGIKSWLDKKPSELSGGQRQRVALAHALLQTPQLLLFDEPFSALDRQSRYNLLQVLKTFVEKHNIATLFVSHSENEIEQLTEHCLLIQAGKIVKNEQTSTLLNDKITNGSDVASKAFIYKEISNKEISSKPTLVIKTKAITLTFKPKQWFADEKLMELKLVPKNSQRANVNATSKEQDLKDQAATTALQSVFITSVREITDEVIYGEINYQQLIFSKEKLSNISLEHCLQVRIKAITEQENSYQISLDLCGYQLDVPLNKRNIELKTLQINALGYIYFDLAI